MLPVTSDGTPLMALPEFRGNPHAWVKLWKHHAAQPHADRINATAAARGEAWLPRYGGKISSEWFLAKALQILEEAPEIYRAADRLIEAADWVIWRMCGVETRNTCTAGYKANFQDGAYPTRDYLGALNPGFADLVASKLSTTSVAARRPRRRSDRRSGRLDGPAGRNRGRRRQRRRARHGAGGRRRRAGAAGRHHGHLHLPHAARRPPHRGAGHVRCRGRRHHPRSIRIRGRPERRRRHLRMVRGARGAGRVRRRQPARGLHAHEALEREAAAQKPGEHGLLALDWWNGNRSVLVDANLSGLLIGMTLATRAPDIYRALIESTAYGTRAHRRELRALRRPGRELVIAGGLQKNQLLMQIYADVTGRPLSLVDSEQGPGARLGHARGRRRRASTPTIADAAAAHGPHPPQRLHAGPGRRPRLRWLYADYVVPARLLRSRRERRDEASQALEPSR